MRMLNVEIQDAECTQRYAEVLTLGRIEKTENLTWSGNKELVPLLLATPTKGKSRLEFDANVTLESIQFQDTGLNPSQQEAVRHSLSAQHVALIHGPPGTGKTHTLVELIRQFVIRGLRVLVCGPSDAAVDNLLERLVPHRLNCLRVGHPGRVQQPQLMDNVLDIKLRYSDASQLVKEIRQEMDGLLTSIAKCKSRSERKQMYTTLSDLRKDFRSRELRATQDGVGGRVLQQHSFDVVVIDEATQAVEAECWIAISRSTRVVLAGDHHQLPPTIKSGLPELEKTLFLRLLEHGSRVVRMLTVQYRMHNLIMGFSSSQLCHKNLKRIEDEDVTSLPLIFVDTAGSDLYESTDEATEKGSRWNSATTTGCCPSGQIDRAGLDPKDIAVISPYNGQVALLKTELRPLYPQLEIGSVDGSNSDGEVGFLKDYRRLNVAITRTRRHLCLIGDSDTVVADRSVPSKDPPPHANFLQS
ncbi:hypothetical protein DSO57_1039269 [Entomophthora muscae]|uniref:Uncharacterized protein n=1 Tax=Entomophthora muscae TaxID=34485 RepID=A0ACC2S0D4_9FUNG|nr:hypothetical protein DSO57_1039269 [Entomophthora muscae]